MASTWLPAAERTGLAKDTELAEYLGVTKNRLAQDRHKKTGVPFIRYGRTIRYRWSDVAKWEESSLIGPDTAA
ncbi:hypothetical protein [Nocardia sp. IFM 10818]